MSDILEFVVKNFQQLRPTDYALLIVFVALASGAIFAAFRWIYAARYQAQKDLLELQGQTVSALSSHLDLTKQERDAIQRELAEKMSRLKELEQMGPTAAREQGSLREEALGLVSGGLLAFLDRLAMVYRMLYLYMRHLSEDPPLDAVEAADDFAERVESLREAYLATYKQANRESLPALVEQFRSEALSQSADVVYRRFMALADEINARRRQRAHGG